MKKKCAITRRPSDLRSAGVVRNAAWFLLLVGIICSSWKIYAVEGSQAEQVAALLAKMTPEEKATQLEGTMLNPLLEGRKFSPEAAKKLIPHGIGHVSQFSSGTDLKPDELIPVVRDLQNWLRHETRLGIPAILHEEAITGLDARGATTYPQQIGMACTWNPELLHGNTATTARQMRRIGATQALSPMLDVCNNAKWGRTEESFGEEPYITSLMGLAFVTGLQGDDLKTGVAATVKHFAGYAGGTDDERRFWEEILMPHEVAVRLGHAAAVMSGYHTVKETPCSASPFLLTDILRTEWGFDGVVVSDYGAVQKVYSSYKFATNAEDAMLKCLNAGLDVELPKPGTFSYIPAALASGALHQKTLDRAVTRLLTMKARLGLLDPQAKFVTDEVAPDFDPPEYRRRAYDSACQSLVLLKNNAVLPLGKDVHSLAVVGPNADSVYSLLGDYTYQTISEFWHKIPVDPDCPKLITLVAGLRDRTGKNVTLNYERGCDWDEGMTKPFAAETVGDTRVTKAAKKPLLPQPAPDWDRAMKLAMESDVIIAAMGENRYLCGEGRDRKEATLPGRQQEFVRALIATGKPVVLVLFGGRANAVGELEPDCRAIVQAWYPGEEGGHAVADLLLGNINPSGKLTFTMPRNTKQCPVWYRQGYDTNDLPLYPFGYGLSYTTFAYGDVKVPSRIKTDDTSIPISFTIKNTGTRAGVEIAQLYVSAQGISEQRPPQELKGFARVSLRPGEKRTVTIRVSPQQLARYQDGVWLVEPGAYEFRVGASSMDIRGHGTSLLGGRKVVLKHREIFFSETEVK